MALASMKRFDQRSAPVVRTNQMTTPTSLQLEIWNLRTTLRDQLAMRYPLFLHETNYLSAELIARSALEAKFPGSSSDDELLVALGHPTRKMVCLHPLGSRQATGNATGPFSLLAILPAFLPAELTLDWSFPGNWSLPDVLRVDEPALSPTELFLRTIHRRGSVAALKSIPSYQLFILCGTEPELLWRPLCPFPKDKLVYPVDGSQHVKIPTIATPDATLLRTEF